MPGANGAAEAEPHESPCNPLLELGADMRLHQGNQDSRIAVFIATVDRRMGEFVRAAGEIADNTASAARDAKAARLAAERTARLRLAPVNEVLAKYHDSVPPTDIEEPMSEQTRNDIHSPYASLRRVREEQEARAQESEDAKIKLAAQALLAAQAAQRAEEATKRTEKIRLWVVALTPVAVALGAVASYFLTH